MILLNYSHPLTPGQIAQVERLTGQAVSQVIALPVQFDPAQPFDPQLHALQSRLGLSPEELQTEQVLVNPPSLNFIAAQVLADLHGRMGYFPPILRLRLVEGSLPPRYEAAEVLNLQALRDEARKTRNGQAGAMGA